MTRRSMFLFILQTQQQLRPPGGRSYHKWSIWPGFSPRPPRLPLEVRPVEAPHIPLTFGWKRETLICSIGKSGIRGNIFRFSTRCIVGEFIQPLGESQRQRHPLGREPEVRHLVNQIHIARGWKPRSRCMTEEEKEAVTRQRETQRVPQRMEAQEAKLQQRMELQRACRR